MGLWQILDEVVNIKIEEPVEVHLRPPATCVYPSGTPLAAVQHHVVLGTLAVAPLQAAPAPAPALGSNVHILGHRVRANGVSLLADFLRFNEF